MLNLYCLATVVLFTIATVLYHSIDDIAEKCKEAK